MPFDDDSQGELALAPRPTDEILRERLAVAVEALNAASDSAERVDLFAEVEKLRAALGIGGGR